MKAFGEAVAIAPFDLTANAGFFEVCALMPVEQLRRMVGTPKARARFEVLAEELGDAPDSYRLFAVLGNIQLRLGDEDFAEELFAHCLGPLDDEAAYSAHYVAAKYDGGAAAYDHAPYHEETTNSFLAVVLDVIKDRTDLTVLDLACGTGKVGAGLAPHATAMIGVDVSQGMVDVARGRGLYDRLILGDMVEAMGALGQAVDLISCCGATYYLPDLTPFVEQAAGALKPDGLLAFTDFPAPAGAGTLVTKGGTRRYCRSPDLVRAITGAAGLTEIACRHVRSDSQPARCWAFQRR